jgi:hypothetical protein
MNLIEIIQTATGLYNFVYLRLNNKRLDNQLLENLTGISNANAWFAKHNLNNLDENELMHLTEIL